MPYSQTLEAPVRIRGLWGDIWLSEPGLAATYWGRRDELQFTSISHRGVRNQAELRNQIISLNLASQIACQRERFGPWQPLCEGVSEQKAARYARHIAQCGFVSLLRQQTFNHAALPRSLADTICDLGVKNVEPDIVESRFDRGTARERCGDMHLESGRIFCDEPVSTSPE